MASSMKSSKTKKKEYNYIIHSHGAIFTSRQGNAKKYMAINIPENVEIFTYTTFGKVLDTSCAKNYLICDNLDKFEVKYKNTLIQIQKPTHKYKYKEDTRNIFPEAMLIPDKGPTLQFYSGIVHCIPHAHRTSTIKGMEIIHNMDAVNLLDCADDSIRKYYHDINRDKQKLYDTNTKYSEYYKELIKNPGKKRDAPLDTINKCGAILLSEAIKIIQAHCEKKYGVNNTIKIYLDFCLGEADIENYVMGKKYFSRMSKEKLIEFITQKNETLTPEQMDRVYYDYLDEYSLDSESIISNNLHATNLEEFAKNLDSDYVADIQDSFSYDYVYNNINFRLITSKPLTHEFNYVKYYKYDIVNTRHYIDLMDDVIGKLIKYLASWRIDYSNLPNNITIDVRKFEKPTAKDIFKKLIDALIVEKLQTTIEYKSKTWKLVVNLLHDKYLDNNNHEYDDKLLRVIKEIFEEIKKSHKNMLSKIVNFNLKLSELNESEDKLYERMKEQIIDLEKATQEEAVARQKMLINLAREAAEKAAREAEKTAKEAEKAAREAETEAEKEATREAEKATREAEKTAEKAAEKTAKTKRSFSQRLMSSFARSSRKVAPEPLQVKTMNTNTNNSQTKKLTKIQRLKSFFLNPRSRRYATETTSTKAGGTKTKFKRKHRKKNTYKNIYKKISK